MPDGARDETRGADWECEPERRAARNTRTGRKTRSMTCDPLTDWRRNGPTIQRSNRATRQFRMRQRLNSRVRGSMTESWSKWHADNRIAPAVPANPTGMAAFPSLLFPRKCPVFSDVCRSAGISFSLFFAADATLAEGEDGVARRLRAAQNETKLRFATLNELGGGAGGTRGPAFATIAETWCSFGRSCVITARRQGSRGRENPSPQHGRPCQPLLINHWARPQFARPTCP